MPREIVKLIFLLTVAVFGAGAPDIDAARPPFKIYTTEEGLAHDRVNRIVRDSRGFLWFCTAEGLSRFDGATFRSYTQDQGLPNRNINDFLETSKGRFLVATGAGLAVFDPNGRAVPSNIVTPGTADVSATAPLFRTFLPHPENRQKNTINRLAEDKSGRIWIGTDSGLYIFVDDETNPRLEPVLIDGLTDIAYSIHSFLNTSSGDFLAGTAFGVFRIDASGRPSRVDENGAYSMLEDQSGYIWLDSGTKPIGLRVFDYKNGTLELLKTYTKSDGLPENAYYFAIKQTSDGRIFVGQHDGLSEFLPSAAESEPKFRKLRSEKVTTIEEDAGGNLWVGSELKGAWKLANKGFTIFGEEDGILPNDDIRAIYETSQGDIVLPLRPNKTLILKDKRFESVTPFGVKRRSWGWHFLDVFSSDGEWWIPTADGLFRYPKVATTAELERTAPLKTYTVADGLPGNEIFTTFMDSRGDIWFTVIGVQHSLLRWDRKSNRIVATGESDGLPQFNGPISFAEDATGAVWFGFYFGGLARYRDGRFEYFSAKDGLSESQVIDLLVDRRQRLWIATSGQGLFRVDDVTKARPEFTSISTIDGLSSNQIICLAEDFFGRIYLGTGRGINRIDQNSGIRIFTQADGLPSNYITRCLADRKGFLWFVSQNTLLRFTPEGEPRNVPPPVLIDKVYVNGSAQQISEFGALNVGEIELPYNENQIRIEFFALSFGAEGNIRYQYKLDEQDWSPPGEEQTINLDVAPGNHLFQVRAVRGDRLTSETPATVKLRILPPYWARWWFIVLMVLLIGAIAVVLYKYRTANLRAINAALTEANLAEERLRRSQEDRLAELEKVRSRIATDLHDDIGASLTQIAILSEVAQTYSRDIPAAADPLAKISGVSNELVGTMSDIVWAINPAKDHLADLTQRMRRFASDVLTAKGIAFHFEAPDAELDIVLGTNLRREVFLIFKESVTNVARHSAATRVGIVLAVTDSTLEMTLADNGRGFSPDDIFAKSLSAADDHGGNGLESMKKRAFEMDGLLTFESEPGQGATIRLVLPLDKGTQSKV